MAKDYFVQKMELLTTLEIHESSVGSVERFWELAKNHRYVEGYVVNPIVNAFYNETEKRVFACFRICPTVLPGEMVSFSADDSKDAFWKMNMLLEIVMLHARYLLNYEPLMNLLVAERDAYLKLEEERDEQEQIGQAG